MIRDRLSGGRAVVAARDDAEVPDTEEITRLAEAAGYEVVGSLVQRRAEDLRYHFGEGKAEELAALVADRDADAVVVDGGLSPGQYTDLSSLLPAETTLVDRYRLVLDIFAEGAGSTAARTQVELATLRYELPRLERAEGEAALNRKFFEKGSPVLDAERRIDALEAKLDDLTDAAADRRERRRAEGFDLVALAGYTNAGKSTLLRRLADELEIEESVGERAERDEQERRGERERHPDLAESASTADRLFETLETTTRRATVEGRPLLVTDTVGLLADLPHELVRSFSATLAEIGDSDAVLAVVDASAPESRLRRRVETTVEVLAGDASGPVVPVLNKVDRLDDAELAAARETVAAVLADAEGDADVREPVAVSALHGDGIERLRDALLEALPTTEASVEVPNTGATQSFLSWLHDRGEVEVAYAGESVRVTVSGRPAVVAEAERRASDLRADGEGQKGETDPA